MLALTLCALGFLITFWAGRRSLGQGFVALMSFGYFYGILRANLLTSYSHFIFDASLIGLYVSQKWLLSDVRENKRLEVLNIATFVLVAWPMLLVFLPFQPLLISLVGLRGNVLFVPLLLLGARLRKPDLLQLANGLAGLNLAALVFAGAEYVLGIQRFYPVSPVTQLIYISQDAGGGFYRIPAIFSSAHAFGGSMVNSLPFLIAGWQHGQSKLSRFLPMLGMAAALLGVLMSATRQNFIIASVIVFATIVSTKMSPRRRLVFLLLIAAMGVVAMTNARFQRFKSLGDTDAVTERIAGSVNRGFFEILTEHPMGNGLGGGGTSIPYFLEGQVRNPIGMENEYARILSEQGIIGFLLWLCFILWFLSRARSVFAKGPWMNSRRVAWCLAAFWLCVAWIGTGLFTSIPGTVTLMISIGWTAVPMASDAIPVRRTRREQPPTPEPLYAR